eukprot:CAMPEP_0117676322 /NCGR_PEP_ID=MMETSP0804-20121206/16101_1 /TAXON_ID=1074897 /ORGANISM="Tetraselmis astigmatica, Strain CCMP880" /LENGTH=433 /DNA_ID=CAMNT_0005485433 /DNA_START=559 /DNA_END=1856 /DNA_ORIENTATION=-
MDGAPFAWASSKGGHCDHGTRRHSSKDLRLKKDRRRGKGKDRRAKDKKQMSKKRHMQRMHKYHQSSWSVEKAAENLEALVLGLLILPCPEIPAEIAERTDSINGLPSSPLPTRRPSLRRRRKRRSHSGSAEGHPARRAMSTEPSSSQSVVNLEISRSPSIESPRAQHLDLQKEAENLRDKTQALAQSRDDSREEDATAKALWSIWQQCEDILHNARKSWQETITDDDYMIIMLEAISIVKIGIGLVKTMFCDKERELTVEDILPLHRWVVETLQQLQRAVEYISLIVVEAYDDEDSAELGALVEKEGAELLREFYELCLDMVNHIETMGNVQLTLGMSNLDGIALVEALAYKLIAMVVDMVKSEAFNHWTNCWNLDDGNLLCQIEEACNLALSLIGKRDELAAEAEATLSGFELEHCSSIASSVTIMVSPRPA